MRSLHTQAFFSHPDKLFHLLGIPLVGFLLDYRPWIDVGYVLTLSGLGFGILGMLPYAWAQIVAIVLFCLFRPTMYTSVSDGFAKIMG